MESEISITSIHDTSLDEIAQIVKLHFPEYETLTTKDYVLLKKSAFVHVKILHNITVRGHEIGLDGTMSPVAKILFGSLLHYAFRGSILEDVKECIYDELKKGTTNEN